MTPRMDPQPPSAQLRKRRAVFIPVTPAMLFWARPISPLFIPCGILNFNMRVCSGAQVWRRLRLSQPCASHRVAISPRMWWRELPWERRWVGASLKCTKPHLGKPAENSGRYKPGRSREDSRFRARDPSRPCKRSRTAPAIWLWVWLKKPDAEYRRN